MLKKKNHPKKKKEHFQKHWWESGTSLSLSVYLLILLFYTLSLSHCVALLQRPYFLLHSGLFLLLWRPFCTFYIFLARCLDFGIISYLRSNALAGVPMFFWHYMQLHVWQSYPNLYIVLRKLFAYLHAQHFCSQKQIYTLATRSSAFIERHWGDLY